MMTKREQVLSAIEHNPVDKVPLFFWIELHTILKISHFVKKPKVILKTLNPKQIRAPEHQRYKSRLKASLTF